MTLAEPAPECALPSAPRPDRPNYRRRRLGALAVLILLALLGYTAAVGLAPMPQLRATLAVDTDTTEQAVWLDETKAKAAVKAQSLPTAIGWADPERDGMGSIEDDSMVWSNDRKAYPIASITKLVTVLVGLEKQPLEPGENGPMYTYSEADRAREAELRGLDAIMHPVPVGSRFSTRELLELMLLPSSNDYAIAYAHWVFGDGEGYRRAVETWAKRHGLRSLRVVEPSGLDAGNVANAADLVRLGRIALQNPTVREITRLKTATIPGVGKVTNTNPLLGSVKGATGLKTGSLDAVGFNLLASQTVTVKGRELVQISATLARPTREARADSGREMLAEMAALPRRKRIVAEGEELGSVRTWQGERVSLVAAEDARAVLAPAEHVLRTVTVGKTEAITYEAGQSVFGTIEMQGRSALKAGSPVGSVRFDGPEDLVPVDVVLAAAIAEPDLWWRMTHPAEVFDWPRSLNPVPDVAPPSLG